MRKKEYYFADFAEWSFEIDLNTTSRYYIHSIRLVFITTLGVFMTNKTLDYYNKNSETFIQSTISADLKDMQNKFLNEILLLQEDIKKACSIIKGSVKEDYFMVDEILTSSYKNINTIIKFEEKKIK